MLRILLDEERTGERQGLPHLRKERPLQLVLLQFSNGIGLLADWAKSTMYLSAAKHDYIHSIVLLQGWWTEQGANSGHLQSPRKLHRAELHFPFAYSWRYHISTNKRDYLHMSRQCLCFMSVGWIISRSDLAIFTIHTP